MMGRMTASTQVGHLALALGPDTAAGMPSGQASGCSPETIWTGLQTDFGSACQGRPGHCAWVGDEDGLVTRAAGSGSPCKLCLLQSSKLGRQPGRQPQQQRSLPPQSPASPLGTRANNKATGHQHGRPLPVQSLPPREVPTWPNILRARNQ